MSVVDDLEELLAAAPKCECLLDRGHESACLYDRWMSQRVSLRNEWELLAQALVDSQKALVLSLCTCDYLQDTCPLHSEYIERQIKESWTDEKAIKRVTAAGAAARLDGLAEVMER